MRSLLKLPTHYKLVDYTPGDCFSIEKYFSSYDQVRHKYVPLALVYDKEKKELKVPGGANPSIISKATGFKIHTVYTHDEYDEISIRSTMFPKNDLQKDMVQFLIGEGKYVDNKNYRQLVCNAETGEGKTFAAITTMTYHRCKMIVIVNRKNIKNNWINEILKFTDIDKARILDCDTLAIRKIAEGSLNCDKYNAFVVIHRSINRVAATSGWNIIRAFFRNIRVGLKVYDEANMEFVNSVYIDTNSNTFKTLYLTANMEKSGFRDNVVFTRSFAAVPKFNQYELGYTDSKKHIVFISIQYNSHPNIAQISSCKVKRYGWFSAKKFSEYQVNEDTYFFDIIDGLIDRFAIEKNMKMLILVSKIDSCNMIATHIASMHHKKLIGAYHSEVGDKLKKNILKTCDIIVSTGASLGFAETIKDLRVVVNCEAFRFKATGNQASGRLRRLENGETCYYIELVDRGFYSVIDQYNTRKPYYRTLFKALYELSYDSNGLKGV